MAFDITPTSGDAPYLLSASFENSVSFGHGYELIVRRSGTMGSCNTVVTTGPLEPVIADALLSAGQYSIPDTVAAGRCDVYKIYIRNTSTGDIIDPMIATINNL